MRAAAAQGGQSAQAYAARRAEFPEMMLARPPSTKSTKNGGAQRNAIHQGWLTKRALGKSAGTLVKSWRKRYFVLLEDELWWYESAQVDPHSGSSYISGKQLGSLPITIQTSLERNSQVVHRPFAFTVISEDKRLVLQAADEQTRDAWVSALSGRMRSDMNMPMWEGTARVVTAVASPQEPPPQLTLRETSVEIVQANSRDSADTVCDDAEDRGINEADIEEDSLDGASDALADIAIVTPENANLPRWRGDSQVA